MRLLFVLALLVRFNGSFCLVPADCTHVPHIPGAEIVVVQIRVVYRCMETGTVFDGTRVFSEKTCHGNETGWIGPEPQCKGEYIWWTDVRVLITIIRFGFL